jgi:SAM-dependent methyltransferase
VENACQWSPERLWRVGLDWTGHSPRRRCDHLAHGPDLAFRSDLYRGTAPYYDRYRGAYPESLCGHLRRSLTVSGRGRLLDLASGTGQIAFPLAGDFTEVVAVAAGRVGRLGPGRGRGGRDHQHRLEHRAAESVGIDGLFGLVAISNAFHRLDRKQVVRRLFPLEGDGRFVQAAMYSYELARKP